MTSSIISSQLCIFQQHGSVYWSNKAAFCLSNLDSHRTLAGQLFPAAFSMPKAPIWQDSSTSEDCKRLEEIFGGPQALADCTGSRAYERFTGNQIARVSRALRSFFKSSSSGSSTSRYPAYIRMRTALLHVYH